MGGVGGGNIDTNLQALVYDILPPGRCRKATPECAQTLCTARLSISTPENMQLQSLVSVYPLLCQFLIKFVIVSMCVSVQHVKDNFKGGRGIRVINDFN